MCVVRVITRAYAHRCGSPIILDFLNSKESRVLVFSGDTVAASTDLPLKRQPKTKYAYFLRLSSKT